MFLLSVSWLAHKIVQATISKRFTFLFFFGWPVCMIVPTLPRTNGRKGWNGPGNGCWTWVWIRSCRSTRAPLATRRPSPMPTFFSADLLQCRPLQEIQVGSDCPQLVLCYVCSILPLFSQNKSSTKAVQKQYKNRTKAVQHSTKL